MRFPATEMNFIIKTDWLCKLFRMLTIKMSHSSGRIYLKLVINQITATDASILADALQNGNNTLEALSLTEKKSLTDKSFDYQGRLQ